jgi:hypothetical protein
MADISTLVQDFSTAQANTAAVAANTPFTASYGTVSFSGGQAVILCGISYGNGMQTAGVYTWNGTGFYFHPTPAPKGGAATAQETFIAIVDDSSTDDSVRVGFEFDLGPASPVMRCILFNTDNTYSDPGTLSLTYSATNHYWLGWSYDATNVYWWASTAAGTWTQLRSAARPAWMTTQTDLGFVISTNRVGGSNTNANLDNLNTGFTVPGASSPTANNRRGGMFL